MDTDRIELIRQISMFLSCQKQKSTRMENMFWPQDVARDVPYEDLGKSFLNLEDLVIYS